MLVSSACARAPERIAAAPVSEAQYYGHTCRELASADVRLGRTIADLYSEQRQSRTDDVLGYVMFFMPVASMSGGDLRHQIALRKGERDAVARMMARTCSPARL